MIMKNKKDLPKAIPPHVIRCGKELFFINQNDIEDDLSEEEEYIALEILGYEQWLGLK